MGVLYFQPDNAVPAARATWLIAGGSGTLLSIHSSSQVIPEPGTTLFLVIGTALVGLARFVKRQLG
jgi:hypothetical protein